VKVTVAQGAGFCFGVKRALKIAFDAAKRGEGPIVTLGPIIHNPQVVAGLEGEGLRVVDGADRIRGGTLVVRSHGLPESILEEVKNRGVEIVDASNRRTTARPSSRRRATRSSSSGRRTTRRCCR
jgi:4-hydroxy-3-methylbut-2-enyl diphosphate reductase IspH